MAEDEDVMIDVTEGPERGKRLRVPADVGRQAISDGWARDPFAPPSEEPETEPEPPTPEQREKSIQAAAEALRKLRGEPDEEEADKSRRRAQQANEPEEGYETREEQPRRGPGRPRRV